MTPHAPTTAELRLFRQRTGIQHDGGIRPATFWHPKGAHDYERREGIGAHDRSLIPCRVRHYGGVPCAVEAGDRYGRMRREAAAMRSRAFEARDAGFEPGVTVELVRWDGERIPLAKGDAICLRSQR